jgi:long-chain acyl-CoA synthetase
MAPAPAVQSVALPNSKEPGHSSIYRNAQFPDALQAYETPEVRTLFESFERSVRLNGKNDCLGRRDYDRATKTWGPYVWESYEEIHARRTRIGSGLLNLFEQFAKVRASCLHQVLTC